MSVHDGQPLLDNFICYGEGCVYRVKDSPNREEGNFAWPPCWFSYSYCFKESTSLSQFSYSNYSKSVFIWKVDDSNGQFFRICYSMWGRISEISMRSTFAQAAAGPHHRRTVPVIGCTFSCSQVPASQASATKLASVGCILFLLLPQLSHSHNASPHQFW